MSRKDERQLVTCEECDRTYPGFEHADGSHHVVGGPTCPNCESASFAEVEFNPTLALSCPHCGTPQREMLELPGVTSDVATTGHDPDGIVEVTCVDCGTTFDVGYETAE